MIIYQCAILHGNSLTLFNDNTAIHLRFTNKHPADGLGKLSKTEIKVYSNWWILNVRPNFNLRQFFPILLEFYFSKRILKDKLEVFSVHFLITDKCRCVRNKEYDIKGRESLSNTYNQILWTRKRIETSILTSRSN